MAKAKPSVIGDYWGPKIARNQERDAEKAAALEAAGWTVLRFWEHEGPDAIADAVRGRVKQETRCRPDAARAASVGGRTAPARATSSVGLPSLW